MSKEIKKGDVLKNKGIVLSAQKLNDGMTCVLCQLPDDRKPYVTWMADEKGNTYWGHYFSDVVMATEDYKKICGQEAIVPKKAGFKPKSRSYQKASKEPYFVKFDHETGTYGIHKEDQETKYAMYSYSTEKQAKEMAEWLNKRHGKK